MTYKIYKGGYKRPERQADPGPKKLTLPVEDCICTFLLFFPTRRPSVRISTQFAIRKKKTVRSVHLSRFINNIAFRAMVRIILFKYPGETRENKEATVREPVAEALNLVLSPSLLFLNKKI